MLGDPIYDISHLGVGLFFLTLAYLFATILNGQRLTSLTAFVSKWSSQRLLLIFSLTTLILRTLCFGLLAAFSLIQGVEVWYPIVVILFTFPEFLVLSTYVMVFFHWMETYVFAHDQFLISSRKKFAASWKYMCIVCNVIIYAGMSALFLVMMFEQELLQDAVVEIIKYTTAYACFLMPAIMLIVVCYIGCIALSGFPFHSAISQDRVSKLNWVFAVWTVGRLIRGITIILSMKEEWAQNIDQVYFIILSVCTLGFSEYVPFLFLLDWNVISVMISEETDEVPRRYDSEGDTLIIDDTRVYDMNDDEENKIQWNISLNSLQFGKILNNHRGSLSREGTFMGRKCFIKEFRFPDMHKSMLDELITELIICSSIDHEYVCQFLGVASSESTIYCITDYYKQGNIRNYIFKRNNNNYQRSAIDNDEDDEKGYNNAEFIIQIIEEISKVMSYLHSFSQIHGYLNTSSILLDDNNKHIKLSGIGTRRLQAYADVSIMHRTLSAYTAPEVLIGETQTKSSDVYSFGVICWELLTCKVPWVKYNIAEIRDIVGIQKQQLPFPADREIKNLGFSLSFVELIKQCLSFNPDNRPMFDQITTQLQQSHNNNI